MMSEVTKYSFAARGGIGRMETGGITPMNSVSGMRASFGGAGAANGAGPGMPNGQVPPDRRQSAKQKPAFTRGGSEPVLRVASVGQSSASLLGGAAVAAAAAATGGAAAAASAAGGGLEDASKAHDADMDSDWLDDEEGDGALEVEEW